MKSVLVTGGTGYFGRAFVRSTLERGYERVCVFSRGEYAQHQMRIGLDDDPRLRWFIGDVRDYDRLEDAMHGVDLVVHAAALKRIEVGHYNPIEMARTNIDGTVNVVRAAKTASVRTVVYLSSDKAYQPISAYGCSKALAESIILAANNMYGPGGPRFAAVRYGNVWGSTGSIAPIWGDLKARGVDYLPVTDPDCTRFFMRIGEAVDLVWRAVQSAPTDAPLVPDLPAYRVGDLAEAFGLPIEVMGLPSWEKRHECMAPCHCSEDAPRMTIDEIKEAIDAGY